MQKKLHLGVLLHFYNNSNNLPFLYYHWCLEGLQRDHAVEFSFNPFSVYIVYIGIVSVCMCVLINLFHGWSETGCFRAQFIGLGTGIIFTAPFIGLGTGFMFKSSLCISFQK